MKYFLILVFLASSFSAFAHGGRVDKQGGHTNKKTTEYHYHKKVDKYDRNEYGRWKDVDRDCQNTRHEILIKNSSLPVNFKTDKQCLVVSGSWLDPYTLMTFNEAKEIDIDHVVPLKEAHDSGASGWSREQKKQFANDDQNLLAVSKRANRRKGSKDPAKWMPKNKEFHCQYIKKWVAVKEKYMLYMDRREQQIIEAVLGSCK